MATLNFTPQVGAFADSLEMLDVLNHTTHKIEFLQSALTLRPDGNLPEELSATGLYYIMDDAICTLKKIYASIDIPSKNDIDSESPNSTDMGRDNLEFIAGTVRTEFESVELALEGLLAVSKHTQIDEVQINGLINSVSKAKDSIRGAVDEAFN